MTVFDVLNQSTSNGNQEKYKKDNKYYKLDLFGYESIAEVLVGELERYIQNFKEL